MNRQDLISQTSEQISDALNSTEKDILEVLDGKQLLVVNLTLDEDVIEFRNGCLVLEHEGLGTAIANFNQVVFGKKNGPESASDIFKAVFGRQINIVEFNPFDGNRVTEIDKIGAILFSGCPVHIRLETSGNPKKLGFPDTKEFKVATTVYEEVIGLNIPLVGICYGHEIMVHRGGGVVAKLENLVEEERLSLLKNEHGSINYSPPYFHHYIGIPGEQAIPIISSNVDGFNEDFPTGVIHLDAKSRAYALSMQAHPELISIIHRIISVGMSGDPKYIDGSIMPDGHKDLINAIITFLRSFQES